MNLKIEKYKYENLKDEALFIQTEHAAKTEKEATLALLEYLVEVDRRKLYCTKSYSTLFEYLIKDLKFSENQASERSNAVRLMRAVPEVKTHLEEGRLSLTSASQIQRFIKVEERAQKLKVKPTQKLEIIDLCLSQSKREIEKVLLTKKSEPAKILAKEKIKLVTPERSEVKFTVTETTLKKLEDLKNLIGDQSLETIFDQALDTLLNQEKKKRGMREKPQTPVTQKSTLPAKEKLTLPVKCASSPNPYSRFIPIKLKTYIFNRSNGRCEFVDHKTKKRCESRYRLQIEHEIPHALGGRTDEVNLRHFCFNHNARAAKEWGLV